MLELHFAGYHPARSVHTRALHTLGESLARLSAGALKIRVTASIVACGRQAAELPALVEQGALDGCYFASSYLTRHVPALEMFDQPFQSLSRPDAFARLDGDTGAALGQQLATMTGCIVLGWWDNGVRHISNAVRPIRSPADCVGLRLRTLDNAQHQAAFARLGFRPRFIDVAELTRAVAERVVDAQENPLTNMVNFNLQAHHKHINLTAHLLGIAPLLVNRERYSRLPRELRTALALAARESENVQRTLAAAEDTACLTLLRNAGCTVLEPDAIDLPAFRTAAAGLSA
jgi:TRAP-type C4-dicarboxylate transport system substrate-binding protein